MPFAPERRAAAEAFALDVRDALGDNVVDLVLFGSTVRGEKQPEGDIDLLLVLRDRSSVGTLPRLVGQAILDTGFVFEVMVVTPEQWAAALERGSAFVHAVAEEGVSLVRQG